MANDESIPHERAEARPDFSKPPPVKPVPASIQRTLDSEEKLWDAMTAGDGPDSTDTVARYAGYSARVRTIMLSAHRHIAYASELAESFRPVAHPLLVRGAYAVSWTYIIGDVAHEGYKAYVRNQEVLNPKEQDAAKPIASPPTSIPLDQDYRAIMVQRAVFQSIASMGLPAFTVHSIVRYSGRAMKDVKNARLRTWGPVGLGLAAVPALPYMFDKPVEEAVEYVFHHIYGALQKPKEKEL